MADRLQHHLIHPLEDESRAILRHRCSHSSVGSTASASSTASTASNALPRADPHPPAKPDELNAESSHSTLTCLHCTRRNVIGVFPRFRKMSNRLLTKLTPGQGQPKAAAPFGGCLAESCLKAAVEATRSDGDSLVRDLPASSVFSARSDGAALCMGGRGARGGASSSSIASRDCKLASYNSEQFAIPLPAVPEHLARGCDLLKTTSRGAHIRQFCLDIAQQRITWNSQKKRKLAHIDLERIAEIRIGEQALWSVANEKSLPHGTTRLFAIVFYDQLVLKTICVVALSDESFYDWIDTLTYLVSSRKAVTTLAQFRRWRLICISRQWWEADQSRETATNSLRFVETLVQCSAPGVASGAALTLPQALQAIPVCSLPRAEKELVPIDYGSSLAPSSLPPLMASARKWLAGNGATYAPPILPVDTATPAMLSRAVEIVQQQQPAQQNVCSNEAAMELTEAVVFGHALQSVDALYHDIAFSFMPQQFFNGSSGDSNNNSTSNEAEDEDDEESDQLTMAGSSSGGSNGKRVRGQRNHVPLRLEMPKSQPYGITQAVFARFLREVQKETTLSDAEVKRRFSAFTQGGREPMTAYDLEAYLFSDYNSVNPVNIDAEDDDGLVKCQGRRRADMDMPLNQYYVSTSHNTYLASDQIVGVASVECYVHALLRGCRCIELDCWDGRCGEPVVSHGHTFTTRILFEDIIIAVSQYAFAASPYPVILSFETHCSLAQQARMATILKKHLGAMLVVAPVGSSQEHELPSPNQLKHRIIVKNKVLEWSGCGSSSNSNSRPTSLTSNVASGAAAALGNSPGHSQAQGHGSTSKGVSPRSSVAQLKRKIAPELSELIVYCKAVHFEGLDDDSETAEAAFDQVTSVSESTSNQLIRQRGKQYIEYNAAQMTRVYPVFSRITSSNFNPIGHWAAGCQLVALNFQTHDRNMQLYEAMFQGTGDVGYVLKPRHLREVANRASGREIGNEGEGSSDNNNNNNNASAASSTSQSAVSLQSALSGRHSTVHINIISASNAVSTHGGARRSGRGLGTGEQRASFVVPDGGSNSISRTNTFHVRDRLSSSPRSLSRSPSDVAMFAGDDGEEGSGSMNQYFQQFPHDGAGYPSLNAAATAAMESLLIGGGAQMQLAQNSGGEQRHSNINSAVRVEVEWISDGPIGGSPGSNSSMEEVAALASTIGQLQQAQLVAQSAATLGGLSTIASVVGCGTAPGSPAGNSVMGNGGYPFHQQASGGLCGTNMATTPMAAGVGLVAAVGRGGYGSGRFVSRNGTAVGGCDRGGEVRWRDASVFRVVQEPELSFVRFMLFEDDVEAGSACLKVDGLKEGYRTIELSKVDKCRGSRPVHILVNVQVVHCEAKRMGRAII